MMVVVAGGGLIRMDFVHVVAVVRHLSPYIVLDVPVRRQIVDGRQGKTLDTVQTKYLRANGFKKGSKGGRQAKPNSKTTLSWTRTSRWAGKPNGTQHPGSPKGDLA